MGRFCSAERVAHSTDTDCSEEPTLAESTEITAHIGWRFTASPQGNAVSRRRRALLHTEFVLRERKREAVTIHVIIQLEQQLKIKKMET